MQSQPVMRSCVRVGQTRVREKEKFDTSIPYPWSTQRKILEINTGNSKRTGGSNQKQQSMVAQHSTAQHSTARLPFFGIHGIRSCAQRNRDRSSTLQDERDEPTINNGAINNNNNAINKNKVVYRIVYSDSVYSMCIVHL